MIKATVDGKNSLIVQPTGSGKSLCFQFPGVVTGKITIVLMPTVSLILDQFRRLEAARVKVTYLGSMQKDPGIMGKVSQGQYDIVLSTPESFFDNLGQPKAVFKSLGVQKKIGLLAIDEAHLIRAWRTFRYECVHTCMCLTYERSCNTVQLGVVLACIVTLTPMCMYFSLTCRPAFDYLRKLPSLFPSVPLMALTATATCDVVAKLKQVLGNPVCEIASTNKPNITYSAALIQSKGKYVQCICKLYLCNSMVVTCNSTVVTCTCPTSSGFMYFYMFYQYNFLSTLQPNLTDTAILQAT